MPTLRNYTTASKISSLTGISLSLLTDNLINQAESTIDQFIAEFYQGVNVKAVQGKQYYPATLTGSVITLTGISSKPDNFYKFLTARFPTGEILPVVSSTGNLLTIPPTSGLVLNGGVEISQTGKFPRIIDQFQNNKYIIPEIQDAVAYQVAFLIEK